MQWVTTDRSSDQHILTEYTDLIRIWIFKNLDQARKKGMQDERKCRANILEIQKKGVIRES